VGFGFHKCGEFHDQLATSLPQKGLCCMELHARTHAQGTVSSCDLSLLYSPTPVVSCWSNATVVEN